MNGVELTTTTIRTALTMFMSWSFAPSANVGLTVRRDYSIPASGSGTLIARENPKGTLHLRQGSVELWASQIASRSSVNIADSGPSSSE